MKTTGKQIVFYTGTKKNVDISIPALYKSINLNALSSTYVRLVKNMIQYEIDLESNGEEAT